LSCALAEAGALIAGVMFLMTGTTLTLAGYAVGAVGLASLYPTAPDADTVTLR
jgi:hypothetical protein